MARIEVQEYEPTSWTPVDRTSPGQGGYARLFVNGAEVEGATLTYQRYGVVDGLRVTFDNQTHAATVVDAPISSMPRGICEIELQYPVVDWPGYWSSVTAYVKTCTLTIGFHVESKAWNHGRTPLEYQTAVVSVIGTEARAIGDAFIIETPLLPEGIKASCDALRARIPDWIKQVKAYVPPTGDTFTVMPQKAPRVFISYAREDSNPAAQLARDLASEGFEPWFDKDDLLPGERWEVAIERAIRLSDYFVALLSKNSVNKRGYVQKEIRRALEVLEEIPEPKIFLIPARLDESEPSHEALRHLQWVDLFPDWTSGTGKLFRALRSRLGPFASG